jgi:signal transduction histidine kinase
LKEPTLQSSSELKLRESRRIERIFIYHRWLYVVAIGLMALVYPALTHWSVITLAAALGVSNISIWYFYRRFDSLKFQTALSEFAFLLDALASWGLMLLFIKQPSAIVYAIFTLIVIEGAVRFSLPGSLLTGGFFILGLSSAWLYRVRALGMSFDLPSYVFWVGLITLVSIMVGMAVREGRKQKAYAEALATDKTLLLERRRISNELHDTVLKSLQGLALEAHALERTAETGAFAGIGARARYIEEVCGAMSQEIRGVVFELRDEQNSNQDDFKQQIGDLVAKWSRSSGIDASVSVDQGLPRLPLKLSHDVRRIITEALINIQKHSGAKHVSVSVIFSDRHLTLEVKDDGHGFVWTGDPNAYLRLGKLGLVSMRERVEGERGIFELKSGSDGTAIRIDIPLDGVNGRH